jgi:hypothetical protein
MKDARVGADLPHPAAELRDREKRSSAFQQVLMVAMGNSRGYSIHKVCQVNMQMYSQYRWVSRVKATCVQAEKCARR